MSKPSAKVLDQGVGALELEPRVFDELCNPATGEVDPEWYRLRLRYRHPVLYWFSMHSAPGRAMKRALDIVFSACALLALAPLFLFTALAIRLESAGPVFFTQRRVGLGGREFPFFKFRSMVTNAEALKATLLAQNESAQGVIFKMKNDPRVTKVGRVIRKFSIDELPQFYNVLRGDMSVVGPRPPVPGEVVQYQLQAWKRLAVVPGLTCVWQVSGRSNIGFADQVRLDVEYILKQNIFYDVYLIYRTVPAVLKGEGAF
ncbi:MAG: sugar transferase [Candidatus Sumerlaeia bacterium]|nr:sugar transferase [Candidatus Sumerlaeia bacterium]